MPGIFDADAELAAADLQTAALLATLPDESVERLRLFVASCRALLVCRVRHTAAKCATECAGWGELFNLGEVGAVAELAALEKLWEGEERPARWLEVDVAFELLKSATGVRLPMDDEGEGWKQK
jgi:hypothetical protein